MANTNPQPKWIYDKRNRSRCFKHKERHSCFACCAPELLDVQGQICMEHRLHVIIFFIIGIVVGAGFYSVYLQVVEPALRPKLSLNQMYADAIKDAMVPDQNKVYDGLTPITENNTNLIWQGTPRQRERTCGDLD